MYLAASPGKRSTIAEVATAFGISEHHVVKVVHFLGKEGFLENRRGRGGGLQLALAPAAINVGRVVRLAEGGDAPAECFDRESNACVLVKACRLRGVLEEAVANFYASLERYSLEDLRMQRKVQWLNA
jgi:Rrf2 family nitric oxide-sensitive transcriptional repressor